MLGLKRNLCVGRRLSRLGFAVLIGLGAYYFLEMRGLQVLAFVIAATLVASGLLGFCPLRFVLNRRSGDL